MTLRGSVGVGLVMGLAAIGNAAGQELKVPGQFDAIDREQPLTSLKPEAVLGKLDLNRPGLEAVRAAADKGDRKGALAALLAYYRAKFPLESYEEGRGGGRRGGGNPIERADKICAHIFQWGPYEEANYGPEMDWAWDPGGDIEWVASIYRFSWARTLASAYRQTGDDRGPDHGLDRQASAREEGYDPPGLYPLAGLPLAGHPDGEPGFRPVRVVRGAGARAVVHT
jgi:hypothetical protein